MPPTRAILATDTVMEAFVTGLLGIPWAFPQSDPRPLDVSAWDGGDFNIWTIDEPLHDFPGVYIFTRVIGSVHHPVYVGQSRWVGGSVADHRICDPHVFVYADHIHCRTMFDGDQVRMQLERRLIAAFNPPLNVAGRTGPAPAAIAAAVPDRWPAVADVLATL